MGQWNNVVNVNNKINNPNNIVEQTVRKCGHPATKVMNAMVSSYIILCLVLLIAQNV